MQKWEVLEACRHGRIDKEAKGGIILNLNLANLRMVNSNTVLLHDLIRELQRVSSQIEAGYEIDTHWATVLEIPVNFLTCSTVLALEKEAHTSINSKATSANDYQKEYRTAETTDSNSAFDATVKHDPDIHAIEKSIDTMSMNVIQSINEQTTEQNTQYLQRSLPTNLQLEAQSREQATLIAITTLESYYNSHISFYDEVESCIQTSPAPDLTRQLIFTALPSWRPVASDGGILIWPQSGGIKHLLPLMQPIGLRVGILSFDSSSSGKMTVRVSIDHIPQRRHIQMFQDNIREYDKTLSLEVSTVDIFDRLKVASSMHLVVNIALSVEKFINQSGRAVFTVIKAFCFRPDNFNINSAVRVAEDLFTQPETLELWTTEQ